MLMPAGLARATAKRSREGRVHIKCAACQTPLVKLRSQVARAKLPMTCGGVCRSTIMKGENNPNWAGGAWTDRRSGYRLVNVDQLSATDKALLPTPAPREYLEHRLVMARQIGRPLATSEHVHHTNGIKGDNRPENLVLMDWAEHSRDHRLMERRLSKLEAENRKLREQIAKTAD